MANLRKVDAAHLKQSLEAPRSGNHHIGAILHSALLAGKFFAVGTAVNGYRREGKIIAEAIHLALNLLS